MAENKDQSQELQDTQNENEEKEEETTPPEEKKKYSDEEVNALINKKFAEWSKKKDQEIEEAKKKESMNAKERAEYEAKLKDDKIAQLEREIETSKIKDAATERLTEKKLPVTAEIIDIVLKESEVDTLKAVDALAKIVEETVAEELKKNARQQTPESGNTRNLESKKAPDMKEFAEKNRLIRE